MKRLNHLLNIILGACIGVFIGRSLFRWWDYSAHPSLYAMQSAPWYTSILLHGAVTAAVALAILLIKLVLQKKTK